ncbi:hypothetical protein DL764_005241 [Monosporascus ibericus]|uniref:Uncharacterized protein n=1 Tax=Monosporascus ibericus TaxID=155417 RepID=A0A4Q4T9M6_9PEZI|nr:hypothetical protein DL764_005241 [Monosporascus ibericus]
MNSEQKPRGYNWYTVTEDDLKYAPPYLRDVPETPKEVECKLAGTWPTWLHGSFLRVGVGRFTVPLSDDDSKPKAVFSIFLTPRRGMHLPQDKNPYSRGTQSANPATEEILVHSDWNIMQICDARTLEPKRLLTYAQIDPELAGYGSCAHPPHDHVAANPAALVWKSPLPCKPCYTHALAMTDKYVVFVRNPVHMDTSDTTKPLCDMMICEHDSPTQFFILDKTDGKHVGTYQSKNFYFFHTVNAYDYVDPTTGGVNIHVDIISYKDDHYPYSEYSIGNILDPLKPFQNGTLVRYQMDSVDRADLGKVGRVSIASAIAGLPCELPRISKPASMDSSYRYVYGVSGNGVPAPGTEVPIGRLGNGLKVVHSSFYGYLFKSDWQTGTFKLWKPQNGESCPSEPIFIQRPGATDEDDGIVISIMINREGTHSILIGLDGKTFEEVARADMPQVYALGPHGSFVEGDFGL